MGPFSCARLPTFNPKFSNVEFLSLLWPCPLHLPTGALFVKPEVRPGLLPYILSALTAARTATRAALKEAVDPATGAVLDSRQRAIKVTSNALYGECC